MVLKKYLIIVLIILICSCNWHKSNNILEVKLENGKSALLPYKIVNADTIIEGNAKYFYSNNQLEDEIEFKKNKKNGWHLHYDSSSHKIASKIYFVDNVSDSIGFFYKNGDLYLVSIYDKGALFSNKWIYPNGRVEEYQFFSRDSILFYDIRYDSIGKIVYQDGHIFSGECENYFQTTVIKLNHQIEVNIPIVVIPEYLIHFEIAKFNSKNKMVDLIEGTPIIGHYASFKISFSETGKQGIAIAGAMKDEFGKPIKNDTLIIPINIIK